MRRKDGFCPGWTWWVHSGERLALGIDVRLVMQGQSATLSPQCLRGMRKVHHGIASGMGIVASMKGAGLLLSGEAWSLLEAGEYTGKLGEAMRDVGQYLHLKKRIRRELIGQLWYPALVLAIGAGVMALMLLWIIPQMRELSHSMGGGHSLPWLTENIGRLYGVVFLLSGSIVGLVTATFIFLGFKGRRSAKWGRWYETFSSCLPWLSSLRARLREARLLRQSGTLLKGGVTLPRTLEMASQSVSSQWERDRILEFRTRLLMGEGFAEAVRGCELIRSENAPLLMAGQESGHLEEYMGRLASELDEQVKWQIEQGTRFLEPAFLLGLSMAIGGLVLAYLLPMVRMFEQLA